MERYARQSMPSFRMRARDVCRVDVKAHRRAERPLDSAAVARQRGFDVLSHGGVEASAGRRRPFDSAAATEGSSRREYPLPSGDPERRLDLERLTIPQNGGTIDDGS